MSTRGIYTIRVACQASSPDGSICNSPGTMVNINDGLFVRSP